MIRNIIINLTVVLLSLILVLILGEMTLRVYHYYKFGINILNDVNHGLFTKDNKLGWKMSKNLSYETTVKDALKNVYKIHVKTNEYGFRVFDNPLSNKIKIFFVGDSFTAALEISNDKTYYGIIRNKIKNIGVFAYGAGGYGSLQEFMILDEFIDVINPDLIIWQFFENDFFDNDINLDMLKSFYNTGMPRPYLEENGRITYRYAKYDNLFYALPDIFAENIRLLKFFNTRLSVLVNKPLKNKSGPQEIAQLGLAHKGFGHSAKITKMIMEMVKMRAGKIPVYLFCITNNQPYYDTIKNICQSVGIHFFDGVPQSLNKFENEKLYSTKAGDKEHLNEKGNKIVSERLIELLKENNYPIITAE